MEKVNWLLKWFAARNDAAPLEPHENYYEKGAIDSFAIIELIEEVESRFRIRFDEADFRDKRFVTVKGLAELISEKQPSGA